MAVNKRIWQNQHGSPGEAWVVSYRDQGGTRRTKNFDRKRDADAFENTVNVDVRRGLHIPDSQSILVSEAARQWQDSTAGLEQSTRTQYRSTSTSTSSRSSGQRSSPSSPCRRCVRSRTSS
jgi:hypothetical protein